MAEGQIGDAVKGTEAAKLKNKQQIKPQAPNTYKADPSEVTLAMRRIEKIHFQTTERSQFSC